MSTSSFQWVRVSEHGVPPIKAYTKSGAAASETLVIWLQGTDGEGAALSPAWYITGEAGQGWRDLYNAFDYDSVTHWAYMPVPTN